LTANALTGNDEMFSRHGFDGFIPKPIDVRHLNTVLNKFIRDRYPEEAKKYKPETAEAQAEKTTDEKKAKLLKVFRRDAEKAIATLRETANNGDNKLFTTTAHAMKSALANIGESEKSLQAAALEKAGLNGDRDFIAANAHVFISTLESLIQNLVPPETAGADSADITEDASFLIEQLQIIKTACEDYDEKTAYAAFDRLKEKAWKQETSDALEKIRDMLFLDSDFDGASLQAGVFLTQCKR